jgi:hypothetical protein
MRKLALACVLALLAATQGCGGGDGGSPTEPTPPPSRGNWIGTISGTHTALGVQGTCTLEMNLDSTSSGQWWIDCPNGARSQGRAIGIGLNNVTVFTFFNTTPASNCPWTGVAERTTTLIDGDFEVIDCNTNAIRSTGTFQIRPR